MMIGDVVNYYPPEHEGFGQGPFAAIIVSLWEDSLIRPYAELEVFLPTALAVKLAKETNTPFVAEALRRRVDGVPYNSEAWHPQPGTWSRAVRPEGSCR